MRRVSWGASFGALNLVSARIPNGTMLWAENVIGRPYRVSKVGGVRAKKNEPLCWESWTGVYRGSQATKPREFAQEEKDVGRESLNAREGAGVAVRSGCAALGNIVVIAGISPTVVEK